MKYKLEKINVIAVVLLRIPHLNNIFVLFAIDLKNLLELYKQDVYFAPILETLQYPQDTIPKKLAKAKHFKYKDNKIYLKKENYMAVKDGSLKRGEGHNSNVPHKKT